MNLHFLIKQILPCLFVFSCSIIFTLPLFGQQGSGNNSPFQFPVIIDDFLVNDDTLTFNQGYPAIAGGPAQRFIITWTDNRNGMADIYAQRLWLNPADTALIWLGDDGNIMTDRSVNIQIAAGRSPDEGNLSFPAPAHGIVKNEFFVAHEYDMPANDDSIDVYGAFYAGDAISGFLVRIDVIPAEVDLNPGDQQQFEAHGYDGQGNEIYFKAIWSADGGDIDDQGVFTAPDQTGDYTVTVSAEDGPVYGTALVHVWPTGVERDDMIPAEFSLSQNYPNPFNSETTIPFGVKTKCHVLLKVYDIQGHEVMTLVDENYAPGSYRAKLNSSDIASGIYLYQIRMGGFQAVRKLVVLE